MIGTTLLTLDLRKLKLLTTNRYVGYSLLGQRKADYHHDHDQLNNLFIFSFPKVEKFFFLSVLTSNADGLHPSQQNIFSSAYAKF